MNCPLDYFLAVWENNCTLIVNLPGAESYLHQAFEPKNFDETTAMKL